MFKPETQSGFFVRYLPLRLGLVFAALSFAQGVSEPTTGLVSQPDQELLKTWGARPDQMALFVALLAAPWCLKPVFGLVSDLIALAGYRRKSCLLAATAVAAGTFGWLAVHPPAADHSGAFLLTMLLAASAVTFADVVIDSLMIEAGRPLGITGKLQSTQWAAIYLGAILTGVLGGFLSERHEQQVAFAVGAIVLLLNLALTALFVREGGGKEFRTRAYVATGRLATFGMRVRELGRDLRAPAILPVGLFLFCWHFNPFCPAVVYYHFTTELGLSEQVYGQMSSLAAVGSIAGCLLYGIVGCRLPTPGMLRLSLLGGLVSNLLYLAVDNQTSAFAIGPLAGLIYMFSSMALIDLAARACPLRSAGTIFAVFMSLSNLGGALAACLGGYAYQASTARWGQPAGFQLVILVSSSFMLVCLPLLNWLPNWLVASSAPSPQLSPTASDPIQALKQAAA